jgi:hypothetical protein
MEKTTTEHYESFLATLEKIIFDHLAIKLATFKGFQEMLDSDFEKTAESFPLLYFMSESLQVDCVMTISKLTEENRGDKTIQRFLKFYDPNLKKIQKKHKGLTLQQVEKDKAKLEGVKQQISRILKQRDKYYAHADNEYFLQPNKLFVDFPNTYDDLADILRVLQSIINDHRYFIKGNWRACMSDFAYLNTFKTMELLNDASDEWNRKYRPET